MGGFKTGKGRLTTRKETEHYRRPFYRDQRILVPLKETNSGSTDDWLLSMSF